MAYIINRYNGQLLTTVEDATLDTTTSLSLLGRNYTGYGEAFNENILFLLENFSNDTAPSRAISGQLWYNNVNGTINVYDGTSWQSVGAAEISETEPTPNKGALWFKSGTDQLYIFNGTEWVLIGPQSLEGFGLTELKAKQLTDTENAVHASLWAYVDNQVVAIYSFDTFVIGSATAVPGFSQIKRGLNLASNAVFNGAIQGNADTASRLLTTATINGTLFDGSASITITANTGKQLIPGDYISGNSFNGSQETLWNINATPNNTIGTVVARDSTGSFTAVNINSNLVGNVTGNVTATTGTSKFNRVEANEFVGATLSGNAFTASKLQTARTINGVSFDGSQNITVPAASSTLTGTRLSSTVVESNLTTLGTLSSLSMTDTGAGISFNNIFNVKVDSNVPTIEAKGSRLNIKLGTTSALSYIDATTATSLGGDPNPTVLPTGNVNLGMVGSPLNRVHANLIVGVATEAQYADLAEMYEADKKYPAGTVMIFGGSKEVTISSITNDKRVAGVISENPAYLMNRDLQTSTSVPIALQGRVRVRVRGFVKKGDMIVTSNIPGVGKAESNPKLGEVIGKSLEDKETDDIKAIEIVVGRL
jgi:hypothetical protein